MNDIACGARRALATLTMRPTPRGLPSMLRSPRLVQRICEIAKTKKQIESTAVKQVLVWFHTYPPEI